MLGAISRSEGTSREWSQANPTSTTSNIKHAATTSEANSNVVQESKQATEVKEKITKELAKLNDQMVIQNRSFRFKYNDDADVFYVQVIDAKTQEVIESLPPEYLLDLSAKLKEIIGLFVDKRL